MLKTVTVGMIAKDEAHHIRDAVRNAKSFCRDVIVVDTGSSDGTARIAREAGAHVHSWPWRNDFAEARNHLIGLCQTDWVLMQDADQRFIRASDNIQVQTALHGVQTADIEDSIRLTISHPTVIAGQVWHHDASRTDLSMLDTVANKTGTERLGDPYSVLLLIRCALHGPWYQNAVHEDVGGWVARQASNSQIATMSRGHVVHYGQIPEVREARKKSARNEQLLKYRLEDDPGDAAAMSYLIHEYLGTGRYTEAEEIDRVAWPLFQTTTKDAGLHRLRYGAARMYMQFMRADYRAVIETSRILERLEGKHPDFFAMRAASYEAMGKLALAREEAKKCLDLLKSTVFQQCFVTHPQICGRVLGPIRERKEGACYSFLA